MWPLSGLRILRRSFRINLHDCTTWISERKLQVVVLSRSLNRHRNFWDSGRKRAYLLVCECVGLCRRWKSSRNIILESESKGKRVKKGGWMTRTEFVSMRKMMKRGYWPNNEIGRLIYEISSSLTLLERRWASTWSLKFSRHRSNTLSVSIPSFPFPWHFFSIAFPRKFFIFSLKLVRASWACTMKFAWLNS